MLPAPIAAALPWATARRNRSPRKAIGGIQRWLVVTRRLACARARSGGSACLCWRGSSSVPSSPQACWEARRERMPSRPARVPWTARGFGACRTRRTAFDRYRVGTPLARPLPERFSSAAWITRPTRRSIGFSRRPASSVMSAMPCPPRSEPAICNPAKRSRSFIPDRHGSTAGFTWRRWITRRSTPGT